MAEVPDEAAVRSWLKLSTASMTPEELETVRQGELDVQLRSCRLPQVPPGGELSAVYPYALALALLRRCGRTVAARTVPLGVVGNDEYGPSRLPAFDAEIERFERPYRQFAFG